MTKQEQIEEITKKLKQCYEKYGLLNFKWFAEALYNAGYQKIPEDSVVLTRERFKHLCDLAYFSGGEEEIRKEAARDIFAKERELIYSKWKSYITMNDLIEFAKQYGVEVKE